MSRKTLVAAAISSLAVMAMVGTPVASASAPSTPGNAAFSMAVYGDAPYGTSNSDTSELAATPAFIANVNSDPDVTSVVHVGDIHSGKQYCSEAYDRQVFALWQQFADPLVYNIGDNEWTDCHKAAEGGGDPLTNLELVRRIFFATPGQTLGSGSMSVVSQAQAGEGPDREYVENVMWQRKGFVFVTVNIPGGSNNDADPWWGVTPASQRQTDEAARRTTADLHWLDRAFTVAKSTDAQGVVVVTQADMWDLDGKPASHLANYEPFVSALAAHTTDLAKPVLLFTGDSHTYRSDNPLQQGAPCTGDGGICAYDAWNSHPGYDVANFHRVVVHGSTMPLEWLKLTVRPGGRLPSSSTTFGPFSWSRVTQ